MDRSRFVPLDVLRAVAIGLVLGRHILWIPENSPNLASDFFSAWRRFGWIGVDLFFVISGFLVGGLLIQEVLHQQNVSPIRFLVRRGLKIYPAFYAFLFLSVIIARYIGLRFPTWPSGFYSELFFLQSYIPGLWPQTWSLAVEEHFYLLLLAFFCIARNHFPSRNRLAYLPIVVISVNGLILMGRLYYGLQEHAHWSVLLMQTHWRLDSLLFGVLIAYYYHCRKDWLIRAHRLLWRWQFIFLPLLIGPCILGKMESSHYIASFGVTFLYIGFGWIVVDAILGPTRDFLTRFAGILGNVGRHSYSIYLWHVPVYYCLVPAIRHWMPRTPFWIETTAYLVVAVGFGIVLSRLIEQPVLKWRNRVFPSHNGPMVEFSS